MKNVTFQICKYISKKYTGSFLMSRQTSLDSIRKHIPSVSKFAAALLSGPLESASDVFQHMLSDFPKNLLFIENVSDEHPEGGGHYVLNEMLFVGLLIR